MDRTSRCNKVDAVRLYGWHSTPSIQGYWTVKYTGNPVLLDGALHHQSNGMVHYQWRTAGQYGTPPILDYCTVRYTIDPGLQDCMGNHQSRTTGRSGTLSIQSPRFKSFGSCRYSLNPNLRPNLRTNSNDSLCHVIDSCKIFGST